MHSLTVRPITVAATQPGEGSYPPTIVGGGSLADDSDATYSELGFYAVPGEFFAHTSSITAGFAAHPELPPIFVIPLGANNFAVRSPAVREVWRIRYMGLPGTHPDPRMLVNGPRSYWQTPAVEAGPTWTTLASWAGGDQFDSPVDWNPTDTYLALKNGTLQAQIYNFGRLDFGDDLHGAARVFELELTVYYETVYAVERDVRVRPL